MGTETQPSIHLLRQAHCVRTDLPQQQKNSFSYREKKSIPTLRIDKKNEEEEI